MDPEEQKRSDEWEDAITARLRKLRNVPVDTSRLEQAVATALAPAAVQTASRSWWAAALHSTRAIAASVLLLVSIVTAVMLTASSGPAYAEPGQMAAMHRELVSGSSVMKVDSIEAAERALADQSASSPDLPDMPADHVMACCLRRIDNKKVACVLLNDGGIPVSMMVADGDDVKGSRSATTVVREGVTYQVERSGNLNMVMGKRNGHWVCLIGEQSVERLIELSSSLRF